MLAIVALCNCSSIKILPGKSPLLGCSSPTMLPTPTCCARSASDTSSKTRQVRIRLCRVRDTALLREKGGGLVLPKVRTSPTDYRGLEVQLQPKLEIARVQSAASLAEVANRKLVVSNLQASLARLRQEEVGVVEHVEALNAELEADYLGD